MCKEHLVDELSQLHGVIAETFRSKHIEQVLVHGVF